MSVAYELSSNSSASSNDGARPASNPDITVRNTQLLHDLIAVHLSEKVYSPELFGHHFRSAHDLMSAATFGASFTGTISLHCLAHLPADESCASVILCVLAEVRECKVGRLAIPDHDALFYVFRGTNNIAHDMLVNLQTRGDFSALKSTGLFVHALVWLEISNREVFFEEQFINRVNETSATHLILTAHSLGGAYANAMLVKLQVEMRQRKYKDRLSSRALSLLENVRCRTFGAPSVLGLCESDGQDHELHQALQAKSHNYKNANDPIPKMYAGIDLRLFLSCVKEYALVSSGMRDSWVGNLIVGGALDKIEAMLVEDEAFELVRSSAKMYKHMCDETHLGRPRFPASSLVPEDFNDHAIGAYKIALLVHAELASFGVDAHHLVGLQDSELQDKFAQSIAEAGRSVHFEISIIGDRGEGKTSLANSLRGLNWANKEHRQHGAGKTGAKGDTTTDVQVYHYNGLALRDVPGCRGAVIDVDMGDKYVEKFQLHKSHVCLLVYTRVVSPDLKLLASLLEARGVKVLLVRNKIDVDIANDMQEDDDVNSEEEALDCIRQHTYQRQLIGLTGFDDPHKLFLISSKYENAVTVPKYDFAVLLSTLWGSLKDELAQRHLKCILCQRFEKLATMRADKCRGLVTIAALKCATVASIPVPVVGTVAWWATYHHVAGQLLVPFCLTQEDLVSPADDPANQAQWRRIGFRIADALRSHVPPAVAVALTGDVAFDMALPYILGPLALPVGITLDFTAVLWVCQRSLRGTVEKLEKLALEVYNLKVSKASSECVAEMITDLFPSNLDQVLASLPGPLQDHARGAMLALQDQ